jgi:hypothetical protein
MSILRRIDISRRLIGAPQSVNDDAAIDLPATPVQASVYPSLLAPNDVLIGGSTQRFRRLKTLLLRPCQI